MVKYLFIMGHTNVFNRFVSHTERNQMETGTATFGVNKFADLSTEEFEGYYLTALPPTALPLGRQVLDAVDGYNGTESLVDWTGAIQYLGYTLMCAQHSVRYRHLHDARERPRILRELLGVLRHRAGRI